MPKRTVEMDTKFFTFNQNNSGGDFLENGEVGIGIVVIIEAEDYKDANQKAERVGLYFGGEGDCPCCGDRWRAKDAYDIGTDKPMIYDHDVSGGVYEESYNIFSINGVKGYIHYIDGIIQPIKSVKGAK